MRLLTHLMFQNGKAAEAADFYASLLDGGSLETTATPDGAEIHHVRLAGHELVVFESPVQHAFDMTPAVSLYLEVDEADQVDACIAQLAEGGSVLMPVADYGFSPRYGWCVDRFGMSWQVSCPG